MTLESEFRLTSQLPSFLPLESSSWLTCLLWALPVWPVAQSPMPAADVLDAWQLLGLIFPLVCSLFCYFQLCHAHSLFFGSIFASALHRFEWLYRVQAGGKCCFCSVLHLKWDTSQHPHGLLSVNLLLSDELRRSLPIAKPLWIMLRLLQVFSLLKTALLFLCVAGCWLVLNSTGSWCCGLEPGFRKSRENWSLWLMLPTVLGVKRMQNV